MEQTSTALPVYNARSRKTQYKDSVRLLMELGEAQMSNQSVGTDPGTNHSPRNQTPPLILSWPMRARSRRTEMVECMPPTQRFRVVATGVLGTWSSFSKITSDIHVRSRRIINARSSMRSRINFAEILVSTSRMDLGCSWLSRTALQPRPQRNNSWY